MNRYEIRCTPEQTRKALELGAPIEIVKYGYEKYHHKLLVHGKGWAICPTAEQMISWLEEQEDITDIEIYKFSNQGDWRYIIFLHSGDCIDNKSYTSRKEATLDAIEEALEYLANNK